MRWRWRIFHLVWLVGVVAALIAVGQRLELEDQNRRVSIVLDMQQVQEVSDSLRIWLPLFMQNFRNSGATAVALSEVELKSLVSSGRIALTPAPLWSRLNRLSPPLSHGVVLSSRDFQLMQQVVEALRHKYRQRLQLLPSPGGASATVTEATWWLPKPHTDLERLRVGLDYEQVQEVRRCGLVPVARFQNYIGLTEDAVEFLANHASRHGVRAVFFEGDEVLGYKDLIPAVAKALRKRSIAFGMVEFANQHGEEPLGLKMRGQVLRVHSITAAEMPRLDPKTCVQRFLRAVKERGIRLCYARLPAQLKENPHRAYTDYVAALADALTKAGFHTKHAAFPEPLPPRQASLPIRLLIAVGGMAGLVWLIHRLQPISWKVEVVLLLWGALAASGLLVGLQSLGLAVIAFGIALVFPLLALLECGVCGPTGKIPTRFERLIVAFDCLLIASALTVSGGVLIAGLLFDTDYLVKLKEFRGVKMAHVLPFLSVFFIVMGGLHEKANSPSAAQRWQEAKRRLKDFLSSPLLTGYAFAFIISVSVLAYWLMRTGNEPGVGVSPLELKVREWFDRIFIVRPRFKEFAIGHPALVLAAFLQAMGQQRLFLPLMLLAVIGQISIINTFTHLHTPLSVSFLRTVNGLWLGYLLGAAAALIFSPMLQSAVSTHRSADS